LIAFHVPIVVLAIVAPLAGVPLVLLPIHLVWLELIVHPVSAIVFQSEPAGPSVMARPPRDPSAPLLPRRAVARSAAAGALLAAVTFAVFWWELPVMGETTARGLALLVLLAGYQALVFVERLALSRSVSRVPRTWTFWLVWLASAISAAAILGVPVLATLFRVEMPDGVHTAAAALIGVAAIAWRLYGDRGGSPGRGILV
jgi:Ca2+-transporting ATPase